LSAARDKVFSVKSFSWPVNRIVTFIQEFKYAMQIFINGEKRQVAEDLNMSALVQELDLADQRIAIEVNEELIPRSTFDAHRLQPGDRVEIVRAIGGG
jgi:sulfur carrier protein